MRRLLVLLTLSLILIFPLSACADSAVIEVTPTRTKPTAVVDPQPSATATVHEITNTPVPSATLIVESTQTQNTAQVIPEDFSCTDVFCHFAWSGWLARPIAYPGNERIDLTYPYASNGDGNLDIHHGVEFPNPSGTPVLAVAGGEVVFAGKDDQSWLGPYPNFYGNVVVLRHADLFDGEDLFSVYGHLSAIYVDVNEEVDMGDVLGEVGASGVADGAHLHLEFRYGLNDYNQTTNPVLWFAPLTSEGSGSTATLAGLILDPYGDPLSTTQVVLESLDESGKPEKSYYFETYVNLGTNPHPALNENFALPDLPPGNYRLSVIYGTLYEIFFTLEAGQLGFVNLQLD